MKKTIIFMLLFAGIIFISCGQNESAEKSNTTSIATTDNTEAENEAVTAAKAWLELIDSQQYEKSWDKTAPMFKNAVERDQWGPMVENA